MLEIFYFVQAQKDLRKFLLYLLEITVKAPLTSWREWRWCLDTSSKWNASVGAERFCGYYKLTIKCCWMVQRMQFWEVDVQWIHEGSDQTDRKAVGKPVHYFKVVECQLNRENYHIIQEQQFCKCQEVCTWKVISYVLLVLLIFRMCNFMDF